MTPQAYLTGDCAEHEQTGFDHPVHGRIRYTALDLVAVLNSGRSADDRIDPPTPEQIAIIEGPLEPTVVIAGAGSGKTTVIGQRVLFLVANGLARADSILGLTFTRKAVSELAAKIRANLREFRVKTGQTDRDDTLLGLDVPVVSTYNSYAAGLVSEYGMAIGVEDDTTVLDDASAMALAGTVVDAATSADVPDGMSRSSLVGNLRALSAQMDEHLVTPEALVDYLYDCYTTYFADNDLSGAVKRKRIEPDAKEEYAARYALLDAAAADVRYRGRTELDALVELVCTFDASDVVTRLREKQLLAGLVGHYRMAKRHESAMEFSDQVAFAHRIMTTDEQALQAERARWSVILLDEYQDTSDTQVRLLTRLFARHAVTAVGDHRQAIYGWRGAAAGNIAQFPQRFMTQGPPGAPPEPAHTRYLSISWRNPKRVLTVANAISAGIAGPDRASAEAHTDLRAPDAPAPDGGPGVLENWRDGTVTKALTSGHPVPDAGSDLMAALVDWLAPRTGSRAVLCRKSTQMFEAAAALRAAGQDVHLVGTAGALDDTFVMDAVAALTVIADPSAGGQAMRLLTGRACRLGPADIAALERLRRCRIRRLEQLYPDTPEAAVIGVVEVIDELCQVPRPGTPLRADLDDSGLSRAGLSRISRLARSLRRLRGLHIPVPSLIREIVRELGIDAESAALGPDRAAPHRIALDVFISAASGMVAQHPGTDTRGFLDWLELARAGAGLDEPDEAIDKDDGSIIVMTIHKSKGLEFDNVAIPHLTRGDLPGKPRSSLGWLSAAELPYPLRGDSSSFPAIDLAKRSVQNTKELKELFAQALEDHHEAEERRLAYVAVTRAQRNLWLGAATFTTRKNANELSPYFLEAATALDWQDMELPDADDGPPDRDESYTWPATADTALVETRSRKLRVLRETPETDLENLAAGPEIGTLAGAAVELLATRDAGVTASPPSRMSATAAVSLAEDPQSFLAQQARPMPHGPVPAAALGTAFHTWVENYFGQATLQDFEEPEARHGLPPRLADRFAGLQKTFLDSEFAARTPVAVELPFELRLDGPAGALKIPGKIDAVFQIGDDVEVVDWKTGHSTAGQTLRAKSVQLSVYALAVAQMPEFAGKRVRASFFYLGDNTVVRPPELLSAAELGSLLAGDMLDGEGPDGAQPDGDAQL